MSTGESLHITVQEGTCGYSHQTAKFQEYQLQQLGKARWEGDKGKKPSKFGEQVAGCWSKCHSHKGTATYFAVVWSARQRCSLSSVSSGVQT